jgi:hypothetical protein
VLYREELLLNVTVFVVGSGEGNIEELIMNVTVFAVKVSGGQYRG